MNFWIEKNIVLNKFCQHTHTLKFYESSFLFSPLSFEAFPEFRTIFGIRRILKSMSTRRTFCLNEPITIKQDAEGLPVHTTAALYLALTPRRAAELALSGSKVLDKKIMIII